MLEFDVYPAENEEAANFIVELGFASQASKNNYSVDFKDKVFLRSFTGGSYECLLAYFSQNLGHYDESLGPCQYIVVHRRTGQWISWFKKWWEVDLVLSPGDRIPRKNAIPQIAN